MRWLVVLVSVVALSACGPDPTPKSPSSSDSPTPTTTLAPPEMPEQAKESGPEGASAFTKYWVDTLNYASNTGDLELLESISANTCSGCNKYINLYRETYAAGGYLRGGFWKIGDLAVKAWPNETLLTTTVQIAVGKSRQAENLPQTRDAAVSEVVSFGASRISGTWRMTQLGLGEIE